MVLVCGCVSCLRDVDAGLLVGRRALLVRDVLVDLLAFLLVDLSAGLCVGRLVLRFVDGGAGLFVGGLADVLVDGVVHDLAFRAVALWSGNCCRDAQHEDENLKN